MKVKIHKSTLLVITLLALTQKSTQEPGDPGNDDWGNDDHHNDDFGSNDHHNDDWDNHDDDWSNFPSSCRVS